MEGGSHQSGNDIDLGTKPDGTRRRAEGGEFFAVINKRSSRRFRKIIPDVINSLNNGTFAHKYLKSYSDGDGLTLNVTGQSPDLRNLSDDVREIKEQNRRRVYVDGDGNTIESYKNLKRKIKSTMTPKYRFFLQIGEDGTKQTVRPNYKDDLTLDYELETNQRFYRAKLSGKINFVRADYDIINDAPFDSEFFLYIEKRPSAKYILNTIKQSL